LVHVGFLYVLLGVVLSIPIFLIMFIHIFCNGIDLVVFVNMFMLKSLIIMVGELVDLFIYLYFIFYIFANWKNYVHLWWFINCNYVPSSSCVSIEKWNNMATNFNIIVKN